MERLLLDLQAFQQELVKLFAALPSNSWVGGLLLLSPLFELASLFEPASPLFEALSLFESAYPLFGLASPLETDLLSLKWMALAPLGELLEPLCMPLLNKAHVTISIYMPFYFCSNAIMNGWFIQKCI